MGSRTQNARVSRLSQIRSSPPSPPPNPRTSPCSRNPCRPVCIVAEGTTFYRLKSLRQKIERYLTQYLVERKHVYYEIVSIDNATLIGAAIAGLTN